MTRFSYSDVPIKPTCERGEKLIFQNKKLKECKHHPDICLCVRQCIISKSREDKNYKPNRMLETGNPRIYLMCSL